MAPDDDNVADGRVGPPFIIDARPDADRGILVTWSLPGLRRATVRVPADAWLNGDHHALAAALASMSDPFDVIVGHGGEGQHDVEGDYSADDVGDY